MKLNLIEIKEITDFEKEIGNELIVKERPFYNARIERFYVSFDNSFLKENGCLVGYFGNGKTIDDAIIDYCELISCRSIVFNPFCEKRKEIQQLPRFKHTKLLNINI